MSDTTQAALAVLCYVVAVIAQLGGIALLVLEARRAGTALRRWRNVVSEGQAPSSPGSHAGLDGVVEQLLGNRFDRATAAALLGVGVVTGAVGNLLSL